MSAKGFSIGILLEKQWKNLEFQDTTVSLMVYIAFLFKQKSLHQQIG